MVSVKKRKTKNKKQNTQTTPRIKYVKESPENPHLPHEGLLVSYDYTVDKNNRRSSKLPGAPSSKNYDQNQETE